MPGSMPGMTAPQTPTLPILPSRVTRAVKRIVIHCSATPSGRWLGGKSPGQTGYRTAPAVIDAWHAERGFRRSEVARNAFNWRLPHIGYHFVLDLDGMIWTGRHLDEVGAHVAGHNGDSVGICLVGGIEREARYTAAQWASLWALVNALTDRLGVPMAPGGRMGVCGHRDLSPDSDGDGQVEPHEWLKTCPGFSVSAWLRANGVVAPQYIVEAPAP